MAKAPETTIDGEAQFVGVNELLPPGALQPGEMASCQNGRFRFGKDEPRLGFLKLPWSNFVTSGASSRPVPYGVYHGSGYFQDVDSVLWIVVAVDGKVFKFREGNGSSEVPIPSGLSIDGPVEFAQSYNGLVMFRGIGNDTLLMASLDAGFVVATMATNTVTGATSENPTDGTVDIPQADRGEWIDARLYVPTETATEKDLVNISDFLNATRFATVRAQARINQGSNDRLIRILKFGKEHAAVCFKTKSIYALYGTQADLAEMSQDEITREFGLLSPRACINVGKDESDLPDEVWFMGTNGSIYKITPDSGTGLLGVAALPVSVELQKTIARINLNVGRATVTFELFDDRLYVAVPLDDATSLSPNLVRGALTYSAGTYSFPVIPGKEYFWTPGENEAGLVNGATTYTEPARFTAAGLTVTFQGEGAVTAAMQRVYVEVNNAVLVYDFVKGKWCGSDVAAGLMVLDFRKLTVGGEERLFFISADGFVNYAEALYDDEVAYETLSNNLHPTGVYDGFGFAVATGLLPGRTYAYVSGVYETSITNGSQTIPGGAGSGTFVAQTNKVTSFGGTGNAIGFALRLVDWTLEYAGIVHDRVTRGYRAGSLTRKMFPWLTLNVRTFNPSFSVTAILDGVNEEFAVVSDRTKDNTRYLKPAGTPRWKTTNQNDDHGTKYRQDYHVELSDAVSSGADIVPGLLYYVDSEDCFTDASIDYNGTTLARGATFTGVDGVTFWTTVSGAPVVYPPGSYVLPGADGIVLDLHQETEEEFRVGRRGSLIQFRLRNTQGRCEVLALQVEAFPVDRMKQKAKA